VYAKVLAVTGCGVVTHPALIKLGNSSFQSTQFLLNAL